jgi:geranylgeranyl pyrophosphate synthase
MARHAPVPPPYRAALVAALTARGNILSETPDARWARLVWTCGVAADGDPRQAVPVAAAVELFMVALDLLDDAEDGEETLVGAALGPARALNVSTGLLLLAQRGLLSTGGAFAVDLLLDAGLQACGGQDADLMPRPARDVGVEEALGITAGKSAPLTAAACRLGALAAGGDVATQERYARFGSYLGMVAQLTNDIAALHSGDSRKKTDVALCRPTVPLVYAAACANAVNATTNLDDVRDALWTDGPVHLTWAVAETYRRYALDLIPALTSTPTGRIALAGLLPRL